MLCTVADVEALIQTNIVNDADPRITTVIELAGLEIEGAVGRSLEAGETDLTLVAGPSVRLFLPVWPLSAVEDVQQDEAALIEGDDYAVDLTAGILTRLTAGIPVPWSGTVTLTATTATPGDIRALCARLAAGAFETALAIANRPADLTGLRQLTIGRWSATTDAATATPGIRWDAAAALIADRWRDRRP